jgi:hypothetical protein
MAKSNGRTYSSPHSGSKIWIARAGEKWVAQWSTAGGSAQRIGETKSDAVLAAITTRIPWLVGADDMRWLESLVGADLGEAFYAQSCAYFAQHIPYMSTAANEQSRYRALRAEVV